MSHRGRVMKWWVSDRRFVWRWEVDAADAVTGKRKRVTKTGFSTRGEAQEALDRWMAENGSTPIYRKAGKVGEWLVREWLPAVTPTLRPTTVRLYETTINAYIVPQLGQLRLAEVNPAALTATYGRLLEDLSPKTVRNVHGVLHRAFRDAVRWGMLLSNPAASADPPRVARSQPDTWTAAELGRFLEHVEHDRLAVMWRLLATSGMRRGEVLGLRWPVVNFERAALAVVASATAYGGKLYTSEPKTASGNRSVALDPQTVTKLREHRLRQLEERMAWGEGYQDNQLVFCREDGSPLRPAWVTRHLPELADKAGLPRLTPHGLRHTWATLALEQGQHPKVVADRLGHSGIQITLDLYSHVTEGLDREAAEVVAMLIDRKL